MGVTLVDNEIQEENQQLERLLDIEHTYWRTHSKSHLLKFGDWFASSCFILKEEKYYFGN